MRTKATGKRASLAERVAKAVDLQHFFIMAVVPIKSENLFGPNIFDIVGNSSIFGSPQHVHLTEAAGVGGLNPPTGDLVLNNLIMTEQEIKFKFEWGVSGSFVHVVNPVFEWRIKIYMEQYGPGEFDLIGTTGFGYKIVPWSSGTPLGLAQRNFPGAAGSTTITIPGGNIPAGLYDVVAVIQLYDGPGPFALPCFAAAFVEFNKINFYQEH